MPFKDVSNSMTEWMLLLFVIWQQLLSPKLNSTLFACHATYDAWMCEMEKAVTRTTVKTG